MSDPSKEGGLFTSLRRLLSTVLEIAQVRLALIGNEVELEKRRLFDGLLWGAIALLILGIGSALFCGFIILLFWDGYRLWAVGGMTFLFLLVGTLSLREARRRLSNPLGMFSLSLSEFAQDRSGLSTMGKHD
jgi:uncharacterized membrane protein YqjE